MQISAVALSALMLLVAVAQLRANAATPQSQVAPANDAFWNTWARTDKPVADLQVSRTWMWGPEAFTNAKQEPYDEAPGHMRTVQYYDKSRMELTDPTADPSSPWYVTNGLLVVELMSGKLQLGDNHFEQHLPASVNVAGDPLGTTGPTYAALAQRRDDPATAVGDPIIATIDHFGNTSTLNNESNYGVTAAFRVTQPGIDHSVASVFWDFMYSTGIIYDPASDSFTTGKLFESPFYATGYPVTEAYWTNVLLAGKSTRVLLQCFERRCLTYTPTNPEGWQVEAGNVGQHYYEWRYTDIPNEGHATATPTTTATTTVTPTTTATATEPIASTGDLQIESIPGAGTDKEHVIIRNMQLDGEVNMQGWKLKDDDGNVYTFPAVTAKAGFYVTVWVCDGHESVGRNYANLVWGLCQPFWNGDTIHLLDSTGKEIDRFP
jgi:hypothetical protein